VTTTEPEPTDPPLDPPQDPPEDPPTEPDPGERPFHDSNRLG
jgi:hypothetical protein